MLLFVLAATIPPVACNFLGFLTVKIGLLPSLSIKDFNTLIFKICIPALLVVSLSSVEITADFQKFFLAQLVFRGLAFIYALVISFYLRFKKSNIPFGVNLFSFFSSTSWLNAVVLGISLVESLYGSDYVIYALLCATVDYLCQVILAALLLSDASSFKKIMTNFATNPAIVCVFVGFFCSMLKISLHPIIQNTLLYMSTVVRGTAHLVAGMVFYVILTEQRNIAPSSKSEPLLLMEEGNADIIEYEKLLESRLEVITDPFNKSYVLMLIFSKVIVAPVLMTIVGIALKLDGYCWELATFLACLPPSLAQFVVARNYNKCIAATNFVVVVTTCLLTPMILLYDLIFKWSI
ncbi:hypothetical protein RCL1_008723 [Eukaryota sp. TZLM3-RCL]